MDLCVILPKHGFMMSWFLASSNLSGLKSKNLLGDAIARTHLLAMVQIIGGYKDAQQQSGKITFNKEAFLATRPKHMTAFLKQLWELQLFQQFLEERLAFQNSGRNMSDEFEAEVLRFEANS